VTKATSSLKIPGKGNICADPFMTAHLSHIAPRLAAIGRNTRKKYQRTAVTSRHQRHCESVNSFQPS